MHGTDALPLPPRPDVRQYRTLAKDLAAAARSRDPDSVHAWATRWLGRLQELTAGGVGGEESVERWARRITSYWRGEPIQGMPAPRTTLAGAHFFLARAHGFRNWTELVRHIEALGDAGSGVARFEAAADAVVGGDVDALHQLLRADPGLARARSSRAHRATLLHYVSANGVEGYRQITPPNIVDVARALLQAGADVNAQAHCYGGGDTPLGLTATSFHPEAAGVMRPLLECLLAADADVGHRDSGFGPVRAALANGRGDSALWLMEHGAPLDLEEAGGVGRLDVVRRFVAEDGSVVPPATADQLASGFNWACEFGRTEVVMWLAERAKARLLADPRQVGLHWAAHEGRDDLVTLLLEHGWPVDAVERSFGGTPLGWALHGWGNASRQREAERRWYETVAHLVAAGAVVDPAWYDDEEDRGRTARKARSDPAMLAALRGEVP